MQSRNSRSRRAWLCRSSAAARVARSISSPGAAAHNAFGSTNYIGNAPARNTDDTGLVRIDHALGNADRLSGRWIEFQGSAVTAGPTSLSGGDSNTPATRSLGLSETHTFNPRFL